MKLYLHKQAENSIWPSPGLWFADPCSRTFRDWLLGVLSAWREVTSLVLCISKHLKSAPVPIFPGRPLARLSQVQAGSNSDLDMTLFLIRFLERSRLVGAEGRRMRCSLASLCWEHVSPPPCLDLSTDWACRAIHWLRVTLFPGIRICNQNMEEEFLDPCPCLSS